jgi:hypothetical protein
MHTLAVEAIIRSVQKRVAQGDCPTEPPQTVETLESVIIELASARLRHQIERDPDEDPSAGALGDFGSPASGGSEHG